MRAAAVLVAGALLLAGCVGGAGPADETAGDTGGADDVDNTTPAKPEPESAEQTEGVDPPTWEVGQWWTYSVSLANGTTATQTFVVAEVEPEKYMIKSDSKLATFVNERDPISFMGHQRRSDLAGSQGEHSVQFFRWPLEEGRSWLTVWDGVQRSISVSAAEQADARFRLVAEDPDGNVDVRYTYDPTVEWFTELTYLDDDGEETIALTLDDHGLVYDGTVWDLSTSTILTASWTGGPIGDYGTSEGGDADDDYWAQVTYDSPDPAQMGLGYGSEDLPPTPDTPPVIDPFFQATCPCEGATETFRRPADQGATFAGGMMASPDSSASMEVEVLLREWTATGVG